MLLLIMVIAEYVGIIQPIRCNGRFDRRLSFPGEQPRVSEQFRFSLNCPTSHWKKAYYNTGVRCAAQD